MRLEELLEMGLDEEKAEEARKAERDAAFRSRLAKHDAAFRSWLGELAEDFEIDRPEELDGYIGGEQPIRWTIRPKWRLPYPFTAMTAGSGAYRFGLNGTAYAVSTANDPDFARFLLNAKKAHDAELEERIAGLARELAVVKVFTRADSEEARLRNTHAKLMQLAPARWEEWAALLNKSLAELKGQVAQQEEEEAFRASAIEAYRLAMEAWADECEAVAAHNAEVINRLKNALGEVKQELMMVEYAVVADDEYGPQVEIRTAWSAGEIADAPDAHLLIEGGRVRKWTIRNIIRMSELEEVTPDRHPNLFDEMQIAGERVFFLPCSAEHRTLVNEALSAVRVAPDAPSWDESSGGLGYGDDVRDAARPARDRANQVVTEWWPF